MVLPKVEPSPPEPTKGALDRVLAERESALDRREHALLERETALRERERIANDRAGSDGVREEEQSAGAQGNAAADEAQNSDLRQANEHLILASLEAQELREAALVAGLRQNEFLAMLAHELRNPLGPIRNAVEILARLDDAQPIPKPILDIMRRQVQQMARLLDDLLDVSRVTQGKVTLQRRPTEVSEFVNQAVESTGGLFQERRQQFTLELPPTPVHVDGDADRLVQVFSNLLQNASKYTQVGGAVTLRAQRMGESVVIRVIDNGMGISAKALPFVFDLFTQDQRTMARSQGGLGIGLTVVRRMVELHGGTVAVSSGGRGQGSEFVVTLPRLEYLGGSEFVSRSVGQLAPVPARVLVIEDNVDAGEVLADLLGQSGHVVEVALDGQSGLDAFDRLKPDVVLCDIGLPGLNGYEVAARMKERLPTHGPVLVALTGYGSAKDHERSLSAGFEHHVVKPPNPEVLLRIIDSAMRAQEWSTTSAGDLSTTRGALIETERRALPR